VRISSFYFPIGSQYYKDVNTTRKWIGNLIVLKNIKLVSAADFDKGVNVRIVQNNTLDRVKILSRRVSDEVIVTKFEITSDNPISTLGVNYTVQANVDVSLRIEYEMDLNLYGFNTISFSPAYNAVPPIVTNIGNNTAQFTGFTEESMVKTALEEFLVSWYYRKYVLPQLK